MNFSEFLRTVPEFAAFSERELDTLERAMTVREYPNGYEFIKEGTAADALYLIIDGEVAVTHRRSGEERGQLEIKRLQPGEMFGLIALIDHGKREATCRAVGKVEAASLPRPAFELLYDANAPLALHFQRMVAHQLMRDFRALIQLIRNEIFAESSAASREQLESIAARYSGPDRRKGDRRRPPEEPSSTTPPR